MGTSSSRREDRPRCGPGARRTKRDGCSSIRRMRQTYYALAGESGSRYGVSFDRLLWHLWQLRRTRGPIRLRSVKYLEDLVLVIACLDHHGGAWADLIDQYESMLVRRCTERVGEVQAILLVRRMLRRLKNAPHAGAAGGPVAVPRGSALARVARQSRRRTAAPEDERLALLVADSPRGTSRRRGAEVGPRRRAARPPLPDPARATPRLAAFSAGGGRRQRARKTGRAPGGTPVAQRRSEWMFPWPQADEQGTGESLRQPARLDNLTLRSTLLTVSPETRRRGSSVGRARH